MPRELAYLLVTFPVAATGFGIADVALLAWAGRPSIPKPDWQDAQARSGFLGWVRAVPGNGHYWLYLLHTMLLAFIVSTSRPGWMSRSPTTARAARTSSPGTASPGSRSGCAGSAAASRCSRPTAARPW